MKKITKIVATIATILTLASCGSDSDSFNPYKEQTKMPLYPKTLSFSSINNDGATTKENWTFQYNNDSTIKSYTYSHKITSSDAIITEQKEGTLRYYTDYTNSRCIETTIYSRYSSKRGTNTLVYTDTVTENVKFSGQYISSISTTGWRTTNGVVETISNHRNFTYANEYCTASTYNDKNDEVSYTYKWNGEKLAKVTIHKQGKESSNMTNDTYSYTYSRKDVAKDYDFNLLAFIYAHNPEIYSAMNLFGKTTPYKLMNKEYESYGMRNGREYELESEQHSFVIMEDEKSVLFIGDSPGYSEYIYTFSK